MPFSYFLCLMYLPPSSIFPSSRAYFSFVPFCLRKGGKQEERKVKSKEEECWIEEHCFEQMISERPVGLRNKNINMRENQEITLICYPEVQAVG